MALIEGLTGSAALAVGIFLVLVFAEYAKIRSSAAKGFSWLAAGAVFLLLEASTAWGAQVLGAVQGLGAFGDLLGSVALLWTVVAWVLILVGSIFVLLDIMKK
ncbi:MAG: hypothetical protein HY519_00160 [Candidatus Aenigmarchaeota archaeon]|nr:hypothetical protein [Candidatus Aenigmarchaeota archaeon]